MNSPDNLVLTGDWADLSRHQPEPLIDIHRLYQYRLSRIESAMANAGVAFCLLISPISLRYAIDYRSYGLFQSHIPSTYLFVPQTGPRILFNGYGGTELVDTYRKGPPTCFFDGGTELQPAAEALSDLILDYLAELGTDNRRVALEYVNPSITLALHRRGVDVVDAVPIIETARTIKSDDEIACMRWAIAVAELGADKMKEALQPGISELQLWGILNYANLVNDGDWHEGHMLASGPRANPWLQEASKRRVQAGELMGFDTDMVGPYGYFADLSRTFFCGPGKPGKRQKEVYQLAVAEIEHNLKLVRPGMKLTEFQRLSYEIPEEFEANAYTCLLHGVGMCDEYPRVNPRFRGVAPYEGELQIGMVLCIESYMGALGEDIGVKLEQQVLVTEGGYELLTRYPFESVLMD